jgi:hypothetical protein
VNYVKYTKTATFLFPLLEIPKQLFTCDVKNVFGKTMMTTRFYNSYIGDNEINNYIEGFIFVVTKAHQDIDYVSFYDTMIAFENYVDDYEKGKYSVFIYTVTEKFLPDYQLILEGKYSKISSEAKKVILQNHFFSGKPYTIPLIFNKSTSLKESWEKRIGESIGSLDVWPIIDIEKEKFCGRDLEDLVKEEQIDIKTIINNE